MKIEISQESDSVFLARNQSGAEQKIDGNAIEGMRPMESLLNALASCAALDLVHILKKQRQNLESLKISVDGLRPLEGSPNPFTEISIHFMLEGNLDTEKVERAVKLSVEKYCSVGSSLDPNIKVQYKTRINS